ncbi:hypothetical protein MOD91_18415 [Bacillus haynesii]|uniref:hypothetical protein n=1 Tax=Bacillus haynesii TaxID=1925021 RepID=UPI0022803DA6|nr:hypothetical protein [Bacillus haynesii]MCY8048421.1 hypothetical protein [Bacillus haynesii]MCY8668836.1 hypothetical protein [Bacillus haynesii]MCY9324024.1 hypothetical protein [Bacillus haynesii]
MRQQLEKKTRKSVQKSVESTNQLREMKKGLIEANKDIDEVNNSALAEMDKLQKLVELNKQVKEQNEGIIQRLDHILQGTEHEVNA